MPLAISLLAIGLFVLVGLWPRRITRRDKALHKHEERVQIPEYPPNYYRE